MEVAGVRMSGVGIVEEGIFISASMRTLAMDLGVLEPERISLLAQRVQEKVSPT